MSSIPFPLAVAACMLLYVAAYSARQALLKYGKSKPRKGEVFISGTYANTLEENRTGTIKWAIVCALSITMLIVICISPW